ncbi:PREDICTED: proclotting enzyme [Nicrophorus vespilloides]|uniref:Proclotting enzyme n=1 Tax=Nicrophorus vespilloides TaxID=110193 RepID=A0ABM1MCX2_NICVS|nr:PREDICTED: proclotting enzyme [Nicrophorus vespilloides]
MNKIHSGILAIVMSIFLIQATDPPTEKTGSLLAQAEMKRLAYQSLSSRRVEKFVPIQVTTPTPPVINDNQAETEQMNFIRNYLRQMQNESEAATNYAAINTFLQREGKSDYEKLLEKEFVRPLLKLYEMNETSIQKPIRRDDTVSEVNDNEHIGEILPPNFEPNTEKIHLPSPRFVFRARKSFDYSDEGFRPSTGYSQESLDSPRYRKPISFPGDRFRPEYEPVDYSEYEAQASSENYQRGPRFNFPPSEVLGYRMPRRQRGFRDVFFQGAREPQYFDQSTPWESPWASTVNRRPRVIFPSDLVAFRDTTSTQKEPDFLAGDSALQDLQQQDTRDRGAEEVCAATATCEFFLSCWLSGGLLESPCEGLLRGCCHRGSSKTGHSYSQAIGTLEAPRETAKAQAALFDVDSRCGISTGQQAQRRIVGGDEAGFGSFPWQAYIRIGSSRCGGSLVSRRHVVTAGHCVARAAPRQVHVTLGDYVINSAMEPFPAYTFGVSQIQVHPFFKFTPQADRFDVAVLRLDRTASHQLPHIAPICLPPKGESFLGEVGVAAGWGALKPGSRERPRTLQAVQVPVIDSRLCERWHRSKGIGVVIYDEMLCAGYKNGGKDSCQGDSGGPLMLQKQNRWYLIGIVSAGYSCAQPGQPGIYHRVAQTVDWITRAINS